MISCLVTLISCLVTFNLLIIARFIELENNDKGGPGGIRTHDHLRVLCQDYNWHARQVFYRTKLPAHSVVRYYQISQEEDDNLSVL